MKLLVVEDNELNIHALTAVLTNQNYAVDIASDGEVAWELIQMYDYDLILLDVMLPKLDGISLCRQIRSYGLQMPILLLTGCDSSHEKAIGLDAGADDYVVKPFEAEELVARVRALLRRSSTTSQPILEWGNLRLDPSSCEVTYRQVLLSLTPKEYALLELFLRNNRRVFSCGMILEHLWSYEDTPGEEAVRTHIKGLRQKLKAAGAPSDLIETVYGIGYRLKPQEEEKILAKAANIEKNPNSKSKNQKHKEEARFQQQTLKAIAGVWQKFQGRVDEQVKVLEKVAACTEPFLDAELRIQAKQEAHTLIGSLGIFGFATASKLARKIEQLLICDRPFTPDELAQIQNWVKLLRQDIQTQNQDTKPSPQEPLQLWQQTPHSEAQILAVDDDPAILDLLQTLLTPWGLQVISLDDPRRFWETLESVKPDMLILDVEMPHSNGIELCQIVRNDPNWSELPILFLTVHNDADIVNQVYSVGADDFVSKPIVGPELVTRIINRLERMKLLKQMAQNRQAKPVSFSPLDERQRIEEELRVSQEKFARILDIADDAIISIDSSQCITLFNQGAEKIFGYSAQEVMGQKLDILLPLQFIQAHRQHVCEFGKSASLARRMGERRELFGRRKDGSEFPAEASISKLNMGEEVYYTVILRDITERKQIERMKDEFVSVVSHELRTPLTSIHGSLGMLSSGLLQPDSDAGKRLLQIATDSTDRLVRLINDILDIERIESGKVKMAREICDLAELIQSAVNVIQPLANKQGVALSISSLSVRLWADPDRIVQTLTNLLSNAIKFSSPGQTVWLETQQRQNEVLLTVKDTGRGIPEDKQESIFERFQQVDSSDSRNHDGTGLGLAICKSIVQQHSGCIWVESTLGQGSTFYVTLPIQKTAKIANSASSTPNSPLVLLCDHDPGICTQLQDLLKNRGYRVVTVATGEQAIATASAQQPDVILLDLLMPNMNGWETMAVLKEHEDTKHIPIVICSVYQSNNNNQPMTNFADWVGKPIQENYLLQSLKQVVAKSCKRTRILIVEDDDDLAQFLITLFEQHEIETYLAQTGREAIHLSQQVNPDLLILDLILPESDGFMVVDWLRQHNHLCNMPVVVYSAKDLDESERQRLKLGHTEFFTKGRITTQEFEQRVMELLQRITQSPVLIADTVSP